VRKWKSFRDFLSRRHGAVTIEFVVTIPLFLAALAFAFEFGQIFLAHQSTVNNVRSAARYLARTGLDGSDFDRANNIIRTSQIAGGNAPDYLSDECQATFSCATFNSGTGRIQVQVRVDYPLQLFGFVNGSELASIPFVVEEDVRWVGM
jgi:Flp pilus assembly protein TadG